MAVFSVLDFIRNDRVAVTRFQKKLWIGLLVMALLTPIGIYLPHKFKSGGAWGEWGAEELEKLLGYLPTGFKKVADLWKAPIPGYGSGGGTSSFAAHAIIYIVSGIIGIAVVALVIYLISKYLTKHEK